MHISQILKNRNKTWKRLEKLGFDLSNCVTVGNRVVFGTINGSKNGLPATDVEIYLWKQLQGNREQAARQTTTTK